uniref:Uncharacterized protein n=1 Tax=Coccidioides posadasii RMSCC 3488 TaxID=454284 RepID=A0A0J6FBR9_COCPO|nr:hypothetical protein CPAG_04031 [Coccidioides posadasii RMSCC 3488]
MVEFQCAAGPLSNFDASRTSISIFWFLKRSSDSVNSVTAQTRPPENLISMLLRSASDPNVIVLPVDCSYNTGQELLPFNPTPFFARTRLIAPIERVAAANTKGSFPRSSADIVG